MKQAGITFFVPGEPKATQTGSVVNVNGRRIPLRRNPEWSARVALFAKQIRPDTLLVGPLSVSLYIYRLRPKSLLKRVRWPETRPDVGNIEKGTLDAMNGIIYRDDGQVCRLLLVKRFTADTPGVCIRIRPLR